MVRRSRIEENNEPHAHRANAMPYYVHEHTFTGVVRDDRETITGIIIIDGYAPPYWEHILVLPHTRGGARASHSRIEFMHTFWRVHILLWNLVANHFKIVVLFLWAWATACMSGGTRTHLAELELLHKIEYENVSSQFVALVSTIYPTPCGGYLFSFCSTYTHIHVVCSFVHGFCMCN